MESLGYQTEIIDYLFYKNPRHIAEPSSRPFYPYPSVSESKRWDYGSEMRFRGCATPSSRQTDENALTSSTRLTCVCLGRSVACRSCSPLGLTMMFFCVGSDQVWSPRCNTSLASYLLSFVPKEARKMSSASSFGVSSLPKSAEETYRKFLSRFDRISVRETIEASIVKKLTGCEATVVFRPYVPADKRPMGRGRTPLGRTAT